ncbi:hypothetical protein O6P43_003638 [Quillaja saponaria]|uniref:Uncharacterized protein n=1 Tax=Quillaja saponaria TaxID=32244 RepID=A0AAD7QFC6_QUISA|nr:hypothetical protein O6P43_003638 [Quillaja saponaria]
MKYEGSNHMLLKCIIGQRACYIVLEKRPMGLLGSVRVKEVLRTSLVDDNINLDDDDDFVVVHFVMVEEGDRKGRLCYKMYNMVEHSGDGIVMVSEGGYNGLVQGVSFTSNTNYSKRDGLLQIEKKKEFARLITRLHVRYFYLVDKKGFFWDVEIDSSHMELNVTNLQTRCSQLYDDMMLFHRCLSWKPAVTPEHHQLSCIYPYPFPYSQPLSYSNYNQLPQSGSNNVDMINYDNNINPQHPWPYSYNNSGTQNLNGLTNSSGSTTGNLNHSVFQQYYITYVNP